MAERTRILYLIDFARHCSGGTERHLLRLTSRIDRDAFEPEVVGFNNGPEFEQAMRESGTPIHHLPLQRVWDLEAWRQAKALRRLLERRRPRIVQTYHAKADSFGVFVSRHAGVPVVISSRRDVGDRKPKLLRALSRISQRYCDRIITVCDAVGDRILADEGVPKSKQLTIYNGVDLERFRPQPADLPAPADTRRALGLTTDDFVVGMIAIFRPEKNYDDFLEAIRRASAHIPRLRVLAVGAGTELDSCRRFCDAHGLSEIVSFPGLAQDVRPYIQALDVGCLTCGSNEGFSNSLLEQMSMGVPLLVTDVGGNREVISESCGLVLPPRDPQRFTDAIVELHRNPLKRLEMSRAGRERAEREFGEEREIRRHEQLYWELLGQGR